MKKSTLYTFLIVFGLLVTGGTSSMAMAKDEGKDFQAKIEQTKQRLNLSEEQEKKLVPIIEKSMEQRKALFDKHGIERPKNGEKKRPSFSQMMALKEDMDKLNADTRAQLSSVLNDEQLAQWDEIQKENKDKMRKRMRNR